MKQEAREFRTSYKLYSPVNLSTLSTSYFLPPTSLPIYQYALFSLEAVIELLRRS